MFLILLYQKQDIMQLILPLHHLDADDAPNVFRSRQREDEAGKEDGGAGPFKLPSLAVVIIRGTVL